ncbi:hypothetical protein [Sphingomonas sp. HMP6]|uniref:hypothetical protein n=1 Tax=Sphingomonas sp. HMP6 TaxID=1517551 RepID=UPI001596F185|nr:hypothetical protein [Sphingomonas sp. HMP6]BCA58145.1 hypothetical protein HMP06_0914 [Sphingomonas sp. HMP6]
MAHAAERVRIDYALPAVTVTAGVTQRITKCPLPAAAQVSLKDNDPLLQIEFAYKVVLAGKASPRRIISLDAESGFLVDRETKVHFNDDWYLKDFNGKTTGQGGPLLISLIKAGAAVAAMTANPIAGLGVAAAIKPLGAVAEGRDRKSRQPHYYATNWYLECTSRVTKALAELDQRRHEVNALEARIITGDASTATQELLVLRRSQVGELEAALTINATLKDGLTPVYDANAAIPNLIARIGAPNITDWFVMMPLEREVETLDQAKVQNKREVAAVLADGKRYPGKFGYEVSVAPDALIAGWFGCKPQTHASACAAEVTRSGVLVTRDMTYVRPIPAAVKLRPCADATACTTDRSWTDAKQASGSADVKLPQLSRHFAMRTGGSIFGGRTVGAEFGSMGEPTMLQYNIGSSGKDVAGVLDASVAAAQTVRDADAAATKRRLDEVKNAKDLQALLDEMNAPAS